jgi:hypothetical protein
MRCLKALAFLSTALFAGCSLAPEGEATFNQVHCLAGNKSRQEFLQALYEGPEDSLTQFYQGLASQLGTPKTTFLHFSLEEWEEYFHPEQRQLDASLLASPLGVQKIMVWDSLSDLSPGILIDLSVQVVQRKAGGRMIDKPYCSIEFRARESHGPGLDWESEAGLALKGMFQELVSSNLGGPHNAVRDTAWENLSQRYEERRQAWRLRVAPLLSGECYPPISHEEQTGEYRIQICERNDLKDTLTGRLVVLDSVGHELPFALVNNLTDSLCSNIQIYDGALSYSFFLLGKGSPTEVRLLMQEGPEIMLHMPGDFMQGLFPFQFRKPAPDQPTLPSQPRQPNPIQTL